MPDLNELQGAVADSRARFEQTIVVIRPELHRYCARMLGSVVDGEDAVQDTLAQAFYALATLKEAVPLRPWLFRIAHNRCIDLIRARRLVPMGDDLPEPSEIPGDETDTRDQVHLALHILVTLPPKERSCLVLKEVLDCSLEEIAAVVDSTVGGVKAALHRARTKLADRRNEPPPPPRRTLDPLARVYIERFNAQDWTGVRELMRADARLDVVSIYQGAGPPAFEDTYFRNYGRLDGWKLEPALVDGEPEIVSWRRTDEGAWRPWSLVRLEWDGAQVARVRDFHHVPYLLGDARITRL